MINPYLIILKFISDFSKKKLFICNREPNCECTECCLCNDDNFSLIDLNIDLVTNNQCIIEILIKQGIKLNKNYDWCIFYLNDVDDINIINIELINNKINFYFNDKKNIIDHPNKCISFHLDDKPKKPHKNGYIITFNYMNFEIN